MGEIIYVKQMDVLSTLIETTTMEQTPKVKLKTGSCDNNRRKNI